MLLRRFTLAVVFCFGLVFLSAAEAAPGDLDTTFSGDGKRLTDFESGADFARDAVVRDDGKIIVAGTAYDDSLDAAVFGLLRLHPGGGIDTSFGTNGRVLTSFTGGGDNAYEVALQENGKIVVAGTADSGAYTDFAVARYMPNGTPDTNFSGDGRRILHLSDFHDQARGVAIAPDGKIVIGGWAADDDMSNPATGDDFAVVRLVSGGGYDNSFSGDGIKTTDFGGNFDQGFDVAVQPDGKPIVGGWGEGPTDEADLALARYKTNGALDIDFSSDGRKTTDFAGNSDLIKGLAIQPNDKILAAGSVEPSGSEADIAVARYMPGGSIDGNFGNGGVASKDVDDFDRGEDVVIQPDGKIVVSGYDNLIFGDFALVRFTTGGTADMGWGTGGFVLTPMGTSNSAAFGLAIAPNNTVLAAGEANGGSERLNDYGVARYKTGP
jgi:uncharacterized delta-60 repeat protein